MEGSPAGEGEDRTSSRRSDRRVLRIGLSLSVLVHVALLAFVAFPRPDLLPGTRSEWGLREVEVPPRVRVPPPPDAIYRPSPPEVSTVDVAEPVSPAGEGTPPPVVGAAVPEPPRVTAASGAERPALVPPEVAPSLEAPEHFRRRLERSYPRLLRDRGVGGVVELQFFVSPRGDVSRVRVAESSGHGVLDRVAIRMAGEMRFLPALNRDRAVGVWVSQRICFVTVERRTEELTAAECEHRVALGGW